MLFTRDYTPRFKPEKQPKPKYPGIRKVSLKKAQKDKGEITMKEFFDQRIASFKGVCQHCGGPTTRIKHCVAHLFPKNDHGFPSIAKHPENSLELCFYSPSCHDNFDRGNIKIEELACRDEVIRKFKILYPCMTAKEKSRVPDILLQELTPEEYERK